MASLIGTKPNQVPTNGLLGGMAFQDPAAVKISGGEVTGVTQNGYELVNQGDVGAEPNQIPLNQHLGSLAYQNADNVAGGVVIKDSLSVGSNLSLAGSLGKITINGPANFPLVLDSNAAYSEIQSYNTSLHINRLGNNILIGGNVGIGVTPSAWYGSIKSLDINTVGSIAASTNAFEMYMNSYWSGSSFIYKNTGIASKYEQSLGAHKWHTAPSGTAGQPISFTQAMTLDANGYLLVGATSSAGAGSSRAQIGSSAAPTAGLLLKSTNSAVSLYASSTSASYLAYGSGTPMIFGEAPDSLGTFTERARIDGSGNLLVGTTTANSGIQSGANLIINGGGTYQTIGHANGTATGTGYTSFAYSGSQIGSITQNGTTAVAYNTSSDYRLKNITGPITTSGAYIDSLKPVEGTWKADGSTFVGLIAHEVQEVSRTNVATGEKDGAEMQAMDYSNSELIANLIAEVQALRKRMAQLEAR